EKYEANVDPLFTKTVNEYIKTADKYLEEPLIDYTDWLDSMRHMAGRDITSRFLAWGVAYQMTGDKKYVDAAAKQFEIASTFPDFNTAHVIDAGESAAGLAVGYDWFYNAFTPEQRAFALKAVREVCLDMLASGLYGRLSSASDGASEWRSFKLMNNYNAIVNAGITLASIATLEHDTDTAFQYISDSLRSIEYTMQMFPPGGAWTEGPNYLNFTLQSIVPWALNMENNFGQSYNIMDGQGMDGVVDFMVASTGTEGTNNMGDSEKTPALSYESYFYFAKRYNRPYASYMRWHDINSGNTLGSFYDLMYWDFEAGKIDQTALADLPKTQRVDGMELFSIRDSYADSEANFYFSAHFGTTTGYHQHWDCGTFVLDYKGKRWAYDLGMDNYNLQNELGYQGYEIFRKRGEAHNMLVIDPTKYTSGVETVLGENAPIIDAQSNAYGGFVYANMDSVYEDADKMTLGYYIDDNMSSVTMRNEFILDSSKQCMWSMMTQGDIEIEGNVAYITQTDGSIKLEFICSGKNARWEDNGNPKPLAETIPADKFAKQKQNAEFKQLRLWFDGAEGDNKVIVKISPTGAATKPIADVTFSEWKLPERSTLGDNVNTNFKVLYRGEEAPVVCPVYDETEMPVFEIVTEDPNAIVEIEYAKDINDKTKIKVWDPNRIAYQRGTISYYKASGVSMGEYETTPIYGVKVSSTPEEVNHKDNMLDNDFETRWTAMAKGEYAIFDLGEITNIDGFATCFYKGSVRQYFFDVYLSDDGENWKPVYLNGESSGNTEELELYTFEQREQARYVKLVANGNSGNPPSNVNFNVLEFRAMIKKY
ncbi:MAG: discoidin domain-containing protein, partial [Clostridia bacterium]|nr:discoidin domain-containing protein [Clostridia bacterium]